MRRRDAGRPEIGLHVLGTAHPRERWRLATGWEREAIRAKFNQRPRRPHPFPSVEANRCERPRCSEALVGIERKTRSLREILRSREHTAGHAGRFDPRDLGLSQVPNVPETDPQTNGGAEGIVHRPPPPPPRSSEIVGDVITVGLDRFDRAIERRSVHIGDEDDDPVMLSVLHE